MTVSFFFLLFSILSYQFGGGGGYFIHISLETRIKTCYAIVLVMHTEFRPKCLKTWVKDKLPNKREASK